MADELQRGHNGELVANGPEHAHIIQLNIRANSTHSFGKGCLLRCFRPVRGDNPGHVCSMRILGWPIVCVVRYAQERFEQIPVDCSSSLQTATEIGTKVVELLGVKIARF